MSHYQQDGWRNNTVAGGFAEGFALATTHSAHSPHSCQPVRLPRRFRQPIAMYRLQHETRRGRQVDQVAYRDEEWIRAWLAAQDHADLLASRHQRRQVTRIWPWLCIAADQT